MRRNRTAPRAIGRVTYILLALWALAQPGQANAQATSNSDTNDGPDARLDSIFATPNLQTPSPYGNLLATAPGADRQIPVPQFTFNLLAPLYFNSNPAARSSGGSSTLEGSPALVLGWATPVFNLPLRFSANVGAETDRFVDPQGADFDKLRFGLRLQYVNPDNDQAYSPFLAYVPRLDFSPTFAREFATRQDLNLGINKIFNFNGNLERVAFAGNTSADTVWSFGMSATAQRRFRTPAPESTALIVAPSFSYVISERWNFSLALFLTQRWFDQTFGISQQDFTAEPIATLEYVLPSRWFGGGDTAGWLGRPALDFQVAYEKNWSNVSSAAFSAWYIGPILKLGWRF